MCRTLLSRRAPREPSAAPPGPPRYAASGASQDSPVDDSTTWSSGQTDRSGNHGSASQSRPQPWRRPPLTSRPGNGNLTFAHTPSARPGEVLTTADSRCASQRSTPRVGTETTSGCRGSPSGTRTTAPRALTRPSARSAEWMYNTSRDPLSLARCSTTRASQRAAAAAVLPLRAIAKLGDRLRPGFEACSETSTLVVVKEGHWRCTSYAA